MYEFIWIHRTCNYLIEYSLFRAFSSRVRVRITISIPHTQDLAECISKSFSCTIHVLFINFGVSSVVLLIISVRYYMLQLRSLTYLCSYIHLLCILVGTCMWNFRQCCCKRLACDSFCCSLHTRRYLIPRIRTQWTLNKLYVYLFICRHFLLPEYVGLHIFVLMHQNLLLEIKTDLSLWNQLPWHIAIIYLHEEWHKSQGRYTRNCKRCMPHPACNNVDKKG